MHAEHTDQSASFAPAAPTSPRTRFGSVPPIAPTEISPTPMGYVGSLDGLRAVAVVLVMASHLHVTAFRAGEVGVTVFFALSGYLITRLLLEEHRDHGAISLKRFYQRRFVRLLPPLYLMLAVMATLHVIAPGFPGLTWIGLALAATYTTDLGIVASSGYPSPATDHTWSLSGEEQFYFVLPLVVVLALRTRWRMTTFAATALVVSVVGGTAMSIVAAQHDQGNVRLLANPLVRGWEFLIGAAVAAVMMTDRWQLRARLRRRTAMARATSAALVMGGLAAVVVAVCTPGFTEHNLVSGMCFALAVATALTTATLAEGVLPAGARWLGSPVAGWIGRRSYALYLWHVPIFQLVYHYGSGMSVAQAAVLQVTASVVLAELSYWVAERPLAGLRRRLRQA